MKINYWQINGYFRFLLYRCAVCRRIERSKEQRPEPVTHQPPPELVAKPEVRRYPQQYPPQQYPPQQPPRRVRIQGNSGQRPNYQNLNYRTRHPNYQYRRNN